MIRGLCLSIAPLLALALPLRAQEVTVYQCTEPDGTITMQTSGPCPEGVPQRVRVIDVPPPVTLRAPHVEGRATGPVVTPVRPVVRIEPDADDATGDAAPEPPPALFRCLRYDQTRYFHDSDEPEAQCRPLDTVGIGGVPGIGAGMACERVRDECEPVPEDALCRAWDTRVREAEFRWKFTSGQRESQQLGTEYQRLAEIYAGSACAAEGRADGP